MVVVLLSGCPGGGGEIGDTCGGNDDCDAALQCLIGRCKLRCQHAPECGDGYACDEQGYCQLAAGQAGDLCVSEVGCKAGLSCQIAGATVDSTYRLIASCTAENSTRAAGSLCEEDGDCRNGTCALGRCTDLCRNNRDCGAGYSCVDIPRVAAMDGADGQRLYAGCLPSQGTVTWSIPVKSSSQHIVLPVPAGARSAELVMSIDDPGQKVGATDILSASGERIYNVPCSPQSATDPNCSPTDAIDQYFANKLRHLPAPGMSVLMVPTGPSTPLETGGYRIGIQSFMPDGSPGTAVPKVTAVMQLSSGVQLDLHFYFLDLSEHPCSAMTNNATLDAGAAQRMGFFQDYLSELRVVLTHAGLALGTPTYADISNHHELDGLDVSAAGSLFTLAEHSSGINVFFVRSLSPIGLQAFGPNPGPAGLAHTPQSGIAIALDTLCYRSWQMLARLTGHQIARYMGLYHNVESEWGASHMTWRDPIDDGDESSGNLMYFSEQGGTAISLGQRAILSRSAVLR